MLVQPCSHNSEISAIAWWFDMPTSYGVIIDAMDTIKIVRCRAVSEILSLLSFTMKMTVKLKENNFRNDVIRWQIIKSTNDGIEHVCACSLHLRDINIWIYFGNGLSQWQQHYWWQISTSYFELLAKLTPLRRYWHLYFSLGCDGEGYGVILWQWRHAMANANNLQTWYVEFLSSLTRSTDIKSLHFYLETEGHVQECDLRYSTTNVQIHSCDILFRMFAIYEK